MKHEIPVSASFTFLKNITITPSMTYTERWYTNRIDRTYDYEKHSAVPSDTTYGFYRIYNYSAGISAGTKLYGMFKPWNIFGEWAKKTVIRHVLTPLVSFSGAPDFGDKSYGYYKDLYYLNDRTGQIDTISYSPFDHHLWGVPGRGKSGTMSFSLDNNLEMKVPIAGTDSTRKITLIDLLHLGMTYNFLADSMNWSNLSASVRVKFGKYSLALTGTFDTYTYSEEGRRINVTRWEAGKGLGRLMSTGTSFSYALNNEAIKKFIGLFSGKKEEENASGDKAKQNPATGEAEPGIGAENDGENQPRTSLRKAKKSDGNYDDDGYLLMNIPWNLNFNYSLSLGYDTGSGKFDKITREYPYKITQSLGVSGNISPTKGWSFNFNTNYDFDNKKFATMQCSIARQMHCWSMSASVIPIGPYQSYYFTIAVNSAMLKDLKYDQSSNFRDSMNWGE
jgi:hypothetical protein